MGVIYLPPGYKHRTNRVTEGVASTGEVSPKGTVSHIEDWEGRVAVEAEVVPQRLGWSVSERRFLSSEEMIERGYWRSV